MGGGQEEASWSAMVSSAKSEGAGLVERTGERRLWDSGGTGGVFLDLGKRSRSGEEMGGGGVSAALPDFNCLVDAARHDVGSRLVEI